MRRRTRHFRPTTEADTARVVDCACGEAKARQFACRRHSLAPFSPRLPGLHFVALAFLCLRSIGAPQQGRGSFSPTSRPRLVRSWRWQNAETQVDTASAAEDSNDVIFLGRVTSRLIYLHWPSVQSNRTRTLFWHKARRIRSC